MTQTDPSGGHSSGRTIGRKPQRGVSEMAEIHAILDDGYVAHVGFVDSSTGEPMVIPVAYGRDGDHLLLHGSTGSRLFMLLTAGMPVCVTVTHLDAMVAARSAFNSSMNYRSVMAFGTPRMLDGEKKIQALRVISDHLIPGIWDAGREMTAKEYAQTAVASLALDDVTAKRRTGGSLDEDDAHLPIWAGQIPLVTTFGAPIADESAAHLPVPDHVRNLGERA